MLLKQPLPQNEHLRVAKRTQTDSVMKNLWKLYALVLLIMISARCKERISFDEAQPAQAKSLSEIPKKYQGNYFDHDDSTFILINSHTVVENEFFEIAEPADEIFKDISEEDFVKIVSQTDSEIKVRIWGNEVETFQLRNDSIFGILTLPDTLFSLRQNDVLKSYNDYDYLNILNSAGHYYIRKVSLQDDLLTIYKMKAIDELVDIKQIKRADTTTFKGLKPTKRQFKKLDEAGFRISREFRKIN